MLKRLSGEWDVMSLLTSLAIKFPFPGIVSRLILRKCERTRRLTILELQMLDRCTLRAWLALRIGTRCGC